VRPAIWLNRRRVVVRLDLETGVEVLVDLDPPGVVREHAHAPVVGRELPAQLLRGPEDGLLEEVVDPPGAALPVDRLRVIDGALQRLVRTVLGPRLRDGLELRV